MGNITTGNHFIQVANLIQNYITFMDMQLWGKKKPSYSVLQASDWWVKMVSVDLL